ncbi:transporter substrate-binding domain-containing protein [uncultured Anaerovibrio sp.]|uniref:transporter substrate-binding domain-containing protein n=1 Tax=uncultured Anaerovibrio sp. TaxID=361586 RepID=UPI0026363694|nr:transporter substrate-binding domain-containing protein [uncultured Anaerovibrio sp.]
MNWKKAAAILLGCALAGAVLVGCGGQPVSQKDTNQDGKNLVKVGLLTRQNLSEDKLNALLKEKGSSDQAMLFTYYDNLSAMQMGLESGKIESMRIYKSVAKYLTERNNNMAVKDVADKPMDEFCFGVRKEDDKLKADLDRVIADMKADGTLDKLAKEYITDLKPGAEPPAVTLPFQPGDVPLRIAVTGDLPPLDLVKADGSAAGFNTAILAEIGKRLKCSIEVVQVASGGRAATLTSKKADVVFWTVVPLEKKTNNEAVGIKGLFMPRDADVPDGMALTESYFKDEVVDVVKK